MSMIAGAALREGTPPRAAAFSSGAAFGSGDFFRPFAAHSDFFRYRIPRAIMPPFPRAAVLSGTFTSKKRQAYTCLFLLVEMIRLELTTYTLRTYRSTG